jgi:cell division protein FtsQ
LSYRAQRLWLTPVFRSLLYVGLPIVFLALIAWGALNDADERARLMDRLNTLRSSIKNNPEFQITTLQIDGVSAVLEGQIEYALNFDFPVSSLSIRLTELRDQIEDMPAVERASLRVLSNGVLHISVVERDPVLIWQNQNGLYLVDQDGIVLREIPRQSAYADLPVLAGDGVDHAVPEALELWQALRIMSDHIQGVIRVGERRWDIVLRDQRRILLPQTAPVAAFHGLVRQHVQTDILNRDFHHIDLRDPNRVTIRLRPRAMAQYQAQREQARTR